MRQLIYLLSFMVFLATPFAESQQNPTPAAPPVQEDGLEAELNEALGEQPPNPTAPPADDFVSPVSDQSAVLTEEEDLEGPKNRVQDIEPRYAQNGLSFGVQIWNHSYNIKARLTIGSGATATVADLSSSSANFQSIGGMLRYAILPFDRLGTDLNLTAGTSLNHASNSFSAIHTIRAEGNLVYTFETGSNMTIYLLGGLGFELLLGDDIQNIVASGGAGTAQVGAGMGLGGKLNAEVVYSRSFHRLNQAFITAAGKRAEAAGAASYSQNGSASVTGENIAGRLIYNF